LISVVSDCLFGEVNSVSGRSRDLCFRHRT